jgi:hypothetical protein
MVIHIGQLHMLMDICHSGLFTEQIEPIASKCVIHMLVRFIFQQLILCDDDKHVTTFCNFNGNHKRYWPAQVILWICCP